MISEKLRNITVAALEDVKGEKIIAIDVKSLTTLTDYMIICTAKSNRQLKALADNVAKTAKAAKVKNVRIEGEKESEWILVDLGDVVVHVMTATAREFYSLEELWEPVKELRDKNHHSQSG